MSVSDASEPLLGEKDIWLFSEGRHRRLWDVFGAHVRRRGDVEGTVFTVWAPNARRVSVVGDFCDWNGSRWTLDPVGDSGILARFVPGIGNGTLYKYEVEGADGRVVMKTDPFGTYTEQYPGYASIVHEPGRHIWGDGAWMDELAGRDPAREPVSIYEVHLGSWARDAEHPDRPLQYRTIAPRLAAHVKELGFTHVELMPVMEHPFGGSWGYQVTGYFAPTSRHGNPDDFRYLVDTLHQAGIGVILDWVPAHFPGDEHGLACFDGTALYEHADERQGKHPDWDTLIFNYGRHEVRNFLLASALYWLDEFHLDGLRVDAVASMLYLDYSREEGEWIPNEHGGRENLAAISLLQELNGTVRDEFPGRMVIAEESTTWPGVTRSTDEGGLGFTFKWNMGWMHDSLDYFKQDPLHRGWHQDKLTFALLYEHTERFLMPLSHDECVHGKGSLLSRMPGDQWQRFANLRLLLAYQYTRPGKMLLFMGTELAPDREWDHDMSLDWHLADDPLRMAMHRYLAELGRIYRETEALWRGDPDVGTFEWIDCQDRTNQVFSYIRRAPGAGGDHVLVVLNMTPVPREDYAVGVPASGGRYRLVLSSDDRRFGGSDVEVPEHVDVLDEPAHGRPNSVRLQLPPLAAMLLVPESTAGR